MMPKGTNLALPIENAENVSTSGGQSKCNMNSFIKSLIFIYIYISFFMYIYKLIMYSQVFFNHKINLHQGNVDWILIFTQLTK